MSNQAATGQSVHPDSLAMLRVQDSRDAYKRKVAAFEADEFADHLVTLINETCKAEQVRRVEEALAIWSKPLTHTH